MNREARLVGVGLLVLVAGWLGGCGGRENSVGLSSGEINRLLPGALDGRAESLKALTGKIVFASNRRGVGEIYLVNANGSRQVRLTNNSRGNGTEDADPCWSPDGRRIAFARGRERYADYHRIVYHIYVMNADGSRQVALTKGRSCNTAPAWSPDGRRIAFMSNRDGGHFQVYVMNTDGSRQTRLTRTRQWNADPCWSPDGKKIAFASSSVKGDSEIYVMNADGSRQTRLTRARGWNAAPAWSPDGKWIAFVSNRGGNDEIYLMTSKGARQTVLTRNRAGDYAPCWSPDGRSIAFHTSRDFQNEIYVMNANGTRPTRLTRSNADDLQPSWWSPRPK